MISAEKKRRYHLKINGWLWKHAAVNDPTLNRVHTFDILKHQFASQEEMEEAASYMCAVKAGEISRPLQEWRNKSPFYSLCKTEYVKLSGTDVRVVYFQMLWWFPVALLHAEVRVHFLEHAQKLHTWKPGFCCNRKNRFSKLAINFGYGKVEWCHWGDIESIEQLLVKTISGKEEEKEIYSFDSSCYCRVFVSNSRIYARKQTGGLCFSTESAFFGALSEMQGQQLPFIKSLISTSLMRCGRMSVHTLIGEFYVTNDQYDELSTALAKAMSTGHFERLQNLDGHPDKPVDGAAWFVLATKINSLLASFTSLLKGGKKASALKEELQSFGNFASSEYKPPMLT